MIRRQTVARFTAWSVFLILAATAALAKEGAVQAEVRALSFTPNGKLLITGDEAGKIRVWRTDTWKLAYEMKSKSDSIRCMDVSFDNSLLCVATWTNVEIWNLEEHKHLFTFPEKEITKVFFPRLHRRSPRSYGPDTRKPPNELLAWSRGVLWRWDTTNGKLKEATRSWRGAVSGHDVMAISSSNYPLFVFGEGTLFSGFLRVSNLESNDVLIPLDCSEFKEGPQVAAFPPSGPVVAAGFIDGSIGVWDLTSGKLLHTLKKHKKRVTAMAFLRDDILVSGDEDGLIHVWDTDKGEFLKTHQPARSLIHAMAVSNDGRSFAVGYGLGNEGRVFVLGKGAKNFQELVPSKGRP